MKYRPHHTAISVRDLDKSLQFYDELGYKQVYRHDEKDGSFSIVHLKLGQTFLEIFAYKTNQNKAALDYEYADNSEEIGVKHLALWTHDIQVALWDMKKKGLASAETKIITGKTKVKYFYIKDPDGIWVKFVEDNRFL